MAGLTNLHAFDVSVNQLSGPIPSLAGLTHLQTFHIDHNQLSGDIPAVPNPSSLLDGNSSLCPNFLNPTPNAAWNAATGEAPWYQHCTALPDLIYANGFESP